MSIAEIERAIAEARNEALTLAIIGDQVGAQLAHNLAAELAQQRDAGRHMEIQLSEK